MLRESYGLGSQDEKLSELTISEQLELTTSLYPDKEALIVSHQDIRWSYKELLSQVNSLALGLLSLGIKKGDRVAIWGPNSFEWTLTQFASAKIGAVMVCINPAYRLFELEYALKQSACKAIITADTFKTSHYLKMLQELLPELEVADQTALNAQALPDLRVVIRMGEEETAGMLNFDEVCQMGGAEEQAMMLSLDLNPDDPINIQYTSGTTGSPKGATLSHRNILNNGIIVGAGMRLGNRDRLCIPVPLYHCFGMVMGNLACVGHGATMVYPAAGFDPKVTLSVVEAERCTALHGVPTMFIACLEFAKHYDLSSLRTGIMAGAPCPEEIMKRVMQEMHMSEVLIAYGQTELSPVSHMTAYDDPLEKRVSTVGKPGPHLEVKITDADGHIVAIGETGEICTRGYSVMSGYWADPERTGETIDSEGWLMSGDLGVMDQEGYVEIVGRIKDMIIRGGENIYPREVEEFLYTLADIEDAHVFGVADSAMGEEVCAWVKLKDGKSLAAQEIREHCQGKITHFKIPRYIRIVESFPMTVTGKIQKFKMREQMTLMLQEENVDQ
ncbi:AMP-binding protein [Pseudoteredinibacter isoporae]